MQYHTFFIGTSKTNPKSEGYYIGRPYDKKFWRTLEETGITDSRIHYENYQRLHEEYGIYLTEILNPENEENIVKGDGDIKPSQVKNGMETLISRIKSHEPNRIGLKNKNAATWFYRYCENKEITGKDHPDHEDDWKNGMSMAISKNGTTMALSITYYRRWRIPSITRKRGIWSSGSSAKAM